jgi:hypothetical protein
MQLVVGRSDVERWRDEDGERSDGEVERSEERQR